MPGWADGAWSPAASQLAGRALLFNRAGQLLLQALTRLVTGSSRNYSPVPVFVSESTLDFFFFFYLLRLMQPLAGSVLQAGAGVRLLCWVAFEQAQPWVSPLVGAARTGPRCRHIAGGSGLGPGAGFGGPAASWPASAALDSCHERELPAGTAQ